MAGSTWTWIGSSNDPSQASNWSPTGLPQAGDVAIIPRGDTTAPVYSDQALSNITFDQTGNGTLAFGNTTGLASNSGIDALSLIDASGTAAVLSLTGAFSNLGTIEVTGTQASLSIAIAADSAAPGMLDNQGQIIVAQGDTLVVSGGTFEDAGAVQVNGGVATITGILAGLGNYAVGTGGTLELGQTGGIALTEISFTGTTGLVKLDAPAAFVGGINGFVLGETLDLGPVNITTVVSDAAGDLVAIGAGGTVFSASLPGLVQDGTFVLAGSGGVAGELKVTEGDGDTYLQISPEGFVWTGVGSTGYGSPGNWQPDSVPASTDRVTFSNNPGTVTGNGSALDITIGGDGTWIFAGTTLSVTGLPQSDGSTLGADFTGSANLNGGTWSSDGATIIDAESGATVSAENGAALTTAGLTIAATAAGALTVNGGTVVSTGSVWVGGDGSGTLAVGDQGIVRATDGLTVGGGFVNRTIFTGTGIVTVEGGGTLQTNGFSVGAGLDGLGGGSGTVNVDGASSLLSAVGGDILLGTAGDATLEIINGGVVDAASDTSVIIGDASNGSGRLVVQSGTLNAGSLTIGILTSKGLNISASAGTLEIDTGGLVDASAVSVNNLLSMAGGTLEAGAPLINPTVYGVIIGYGTIVAPALDFAFVTASGGTLEFTGTTLVGTAAIDGGATLQLDNAAGSGASVSFATSAQPETLVLGAPQAADSLAIGNWQSGDVVVFSNGVTVNGAQWVGGTLDVATSKGAYDFTAVNLAPGALPIFSIGANSVGLVSCFTSGTRIATPYGERFVDELAVGDAVFTLLRSAPQPIVWIGHRKVDCADHPRPQQVWPVRIAANALGGGQPTRPLYLSPDHAVYVDDVLIPVKYLCNGSSILQMPTDHVTYYHVELARHDVVLAEGLPAETYLDTGDRRNFSAASQAIALHPDFSSRVWEAEGCAELVVTGSKLDAVRARLAWIASRLQGGGSPAGHSAA